MLVDFETKKRAANPENATGININLSLQFAKQFEKYAKEEVEDRIKKNKHLGIRFSNGMLRLSGDAMGGMYTDVIAKIRDHLNQIFRECNGSRFSKMFVVGGFAESAYLQEFLRAEFGNKLRICIPEEAGMCIMKGAVMYGHNTKVISSRIARFNYCISKWKRYDEHLHGQHQVRDKIGYKEARVLHVLINKDERVSIDDIREHRIEPYGEKPRISLFSTSENTDNPINPSATFLQKISVRSPISPKAERYLKVSLRFGGTEIYFKALDEESGNEAETLVEI